MMPRVDERKEVVGADETAAGMPWSCMTCKTSSKLYGEIRRGSEMRIR